MGHARSYPAQSNHLRSSRSQTLLLVSSCNLQRSLFVKGEEPWLWPHFSYRVALASGKFYVQLLLIRWQAQFSIISQKSAAQFMSEEHFQSFYRWCWAVKLVVAVMRQICSCQWDKFIPRDLELLSLEGFSEIIQCFSYCLTVIPFCLSLTFDQMSLDSRPVSVLIRVLFDVSSFLAYTSYWDMLA